jgi:hypothetical protein
MCFYEWPNGYCKEGYQKEEVFSICNYISPFKTNETYDEL